MNDTINRYLTILCYPFASLDFFEEDFFEEIIRNKKTRKETEKRLQTAAIQYVQRTCSVYSYDEVYMYLERCYMSALRECSYQDVMKLYLDCLDKITRAMISQRDGKIVYKYWKNDCEEDFFGDFGDTNKIFLFHSMNMHIPMDFIVMLYMAKNPQNDIRSLDNYYGQIEAADQQLDMILKEGVAENHLHKGVSMSFFEIWEALMKPLSGFSVRDIERDTPEWGRTRQEEVNILSFVLAAGVVRIYVALKLSDCFICDNDLEELVGYFESGKELKEFYRKQWGSMKEDEAKHELLLYYQKLWERLLQILPEQETDRSMMQEIFQVPVDVHTSDENIFLFYAMRYLNDQISEQSDTRQISRCILQYLRIKNYAFGCTVQKKNIRGLDYFQGEYYRKDSKLNRLYGKLSSDLSKPESKRVYWEQALRKQFHNSNLKKIEFRMSISEKETCLRKDVRAFLEAYRNVIRTDYCINKEGVYKVIRPFPRAGLVFHLLKEKDDTVPDKCILEGTKEKIQFGMLAEKYCEQIIYMRNLRDAIPGLNQYIVGIDAASLENSTPVWVFLKAYEKARDSSVERVQYNQMELPTQSLRFTFHAGEDFRHILSGLRRMDEAVTFLKFHSGDRIGHGTALGISPERWQHHNPFVVLPKIEALDNYLWAYYVLSQDIVSVHSTLATYLERRIYELAQKIYGKSKSISLQGLIEGYLKMFDFKFVDYGYCRKADDVGFCKEVRSETCDEIVWNDEKIALSRHCRKFLLQMEQPIHYEVTEQDIQITEVLQNILRKKMSRKGIIVEINPSSNVAIGEVDKIIDNQIYQLNRPDGENNVMVCINSDDPTVFHTNVSNELAYIYYGMLHKTGDREKTLNWINKVRECGIKASFLQGESTDQQTYDMLEKIVESL